MICKRRETCFSFKAGRHPPNQHVRVTITCQYWNGEYCTDKIAGVKEGDACDINKIRRLKGK